VRRHRSAEGETGETKGQRGGGGRGERRKHEYGTDRGFILIRRSIPSTTGKPASRRLSSAGFASPRSGGWGSSRYEPNQGKKRREETETEKKRSIFQGNTPKLKETDKSRARKATVGLLRRAFRVKLAPDFQAYETQRSARQGIRFP